MPNFTGRNREEVDALRKAHDEYIKKNLAKTTADLDREKAEDTAKRQANARAEASRIELEAHIKATQTPQERFKQIVNDGGLVAAGVLAPQNELDKAIEQLNTLTKSLVKVSPLDALAQTEMEEGLYERTEESNSDGEVYARTIGGIPEHDGIPTGSNIINPDPIEQEREVGGGEGSGEGTEQGSGDEGDSTDGGASEQTPAVDTDGPAIG
jgi:hypothetical protein